MPRIATLHNSQPARLDLVTYRGDSLSATLTLTSMGFALDVSEWYFQAQVRMVPNAPVMATFDIEMLDPANGRIRLVLAADQADRIEGEFPWDLQATELQTGHVHTLVRGFIRSHGDVTKDSVVRSRRAVRRGV